MTILEVLEGDKIIITGYKNLGPLFIVWPSFLSVKLVKTLFKACLTVWTPGILPCRTSFLQCLLFQDLSNYFVEFSVILTNRKWLPKLKLFNICGEPMSGKITVSEMSASTLVQWQWKFLHTSLWTIFKGTFSLLLNIPLKFVDSYFCGLSIHLHFVGHWIYLERYLEFQMVYSNAMSYEIPFIYKLTKPEQKTPNYLVW